MDDLRIPKNGGSKLFGVKEIDDDGIDMPGLGEEEVDENMIV